MTHITVVFESGTYYEEDMNISLDDTRKIAHTMGQRGFWSKDGMRFYPAHTVAHIDLAEVPS